MILLYCNNIHVHRHQNKNMSAWLLYSGYFLSVEFCFYKKRKIFVRPIFVPAALIYYVHAYNNCYSWVKVSLCQFQNKKQRNFDLTKNMHYMYKVMQNIKKNQQPPMQVCVLWQAHLPSMQLHHFLCCSWQLV